MRPEICNVQISVISLKLLQRSLNVMCHHLVLAWAGGKLGHHL